MSEFKVGDKVRVKSEAYPYSGQVGTVVKIENHRTYTCKVAFDDDRDSWYSDEELEAQPVRTPRQPTADEWILGPGDTHPTFMGNAVFTNQSPGKVFLDVRAHVARPEYEGDECVVTRTTMGFGGTVHVERVPVREPAPEPSQKVLFASDGTPVTGGAAAWGKTHSFQNEVYTSGAPVQVAALRYNSSKPESDYILTYDGGVEAVFHQDFEYYNTMEALSTMYRAGAADDQHYLAAELLDLLRQDALDAGDDIATLLALTNRLGGIKYEPGNYLKGANHRQYYQSAVRHGVSIQNGVEFEPDSVLVQKAKEKGVYEQLKEEIDRGFPMRGNFFFNLLALVHCIRNGLGTDDRIRSTT